MKDKIMKKVRVVAALLFCCMFAKAMDFNEKLYRNEQALKVLKYLTLHLEDDLGDLKPKKRGYTDLIRNGCLTASLAGLYMFGYSCYVINSDQCPTQAITDEIHGYTLLQLPIFWNFTQKLDTLYDRQKLLVAQLQAKLPDKSE